jgi:hypothetical protein
MAYQTKFDGKTDATIKLGGEGNPESIEGYFMGTKTTQSEFGEGKLHLFQTPGGVVGVWGKSYMNRLLTEDLRGMMVLVSFTGMVAPSKKGRRPAYGYKVQFDKDNTIDVSGVNLGAAADSEDEGSDDAHLFDGGEEQEVTSYKAPIAPAKPASTPSSDRQAQLQALLSKRK